jgi:hypothetical protein
VWDLDSLEAVCAALLGNLEFPSLGRIRKEKKSGDSSQRRRIHGSPICGV